jgi:radical SAM protein with 4Fe4S-binding SPASM domain
MLVINPNGDVALCSEDLRFEEIMGNIRDQGMFALWRSQKYNGIRARLLDGDRPCMSTCAQCDYRGYTLEILREVEEVSAVQVAAPRRA